ncbi:hypothetical protein [Alteromonas antoniana]|uniref:hypothetical protein n=1 Tax=Alteromonas antoniana TaxID=2803813 RepID=UPI001C4645BC|nr:hypothetical protein [Alteromonas antoniana]
MKEPAKFIRFHGGLLLFALATSLLFMLTGIIEKPDVIAAAIVAFVSLEIMAFMPNRE